MMKIFPAAVLALLLATCLPLQAQSAPGQNTPKHTFVLHSPDIKDGQTLANDFVFNGFGCTGGNQSPELMWQNAPKSTQSYAITAYDPDAPTGSGWWHWLAYNVPAEQMKLGKNSEVQNHDNDILYGRNDYGKYAFGGACPPKGDKPHRYIFTVYALKVAKLDVPKDASAALIGYMIHANSLAKAQITAKYGRQ